MHVVRLGQGVDRTGRLDPEALARTFERSREYAAKIAELGATRVRFVATSATRDASNRDEFFSGIREILGVTPEVVSGDEEAYLSFRGATGVFGGQFPAPYLVVDLGGGSTELVLGTDRPQAAKSMDVGCVRMTERHLRSDPPTLPRSRPPVPTFVGRWTRQPKSYRWGRRRPWWAWRDQLRP